MKKTLLKYSVLLCVSLGVLFIFIASLLYPGGSILDKNAIRFDWTKNFISNLFLPKALNGADNPSQIWAIIGIAFHSVGYGIFFIHMSRKMVAKRVALVVRTIGILNIIFTFLIATPLHDRMVIISSTLFLIGLFYCTVSIFKTKLILFKLACVACLLLFYYTLFLYGCGNFRLLAIMQKVTFICSILLVLGLEYGTKKEDFE